MISFKKRERLPNRSVRRQRGIGEWRGFSWLQTFQLHEVTIVWHQEIFGVAPIMLGETCPLRPVAQLFVPRHARIADPASPATVDGHRIAFLDGLDSCTQGDNPPGLSLIHI